MVGLVLYISSINDEMLNRTKTYETYFSYKYGWSFAFAAISFLLDEVTLYLPLPVLLVVDPTSLHAQDRLLGASWRERGFRGAICIPLPCV